ncbi:unnamed protein product [Dibothriocephalus latus]|uniref:MUN domain-containing protein n=1 Tax=Dibothriocephalus latus TaxID=60516 RepID=A0A3P7LAY0_DIBLA|nr:unnamed protein product [Dibothriocephalus latus]
MRMFFVDFHQVTFFSSVPFMQHQYHNQTEANLEKMQRRLAYILNEKLGTILEGVLLKLARYDSNTLLSSVLSLTKPTDEVGKAYVEFMRVNLEQLRQKLSDEVYVLSTMEVKAFPPMIYCLFPRTVSFLLGPRINRQGKVQSYIFVSKLEY